MNTRLKHKNLNAETKEAIDFACSTNYQTHFMFYWCHWSSFSNEQLQNVSISNWKLNKVQSSCKRMSKNLEKLKNGDLEQTQICILWQNKKIKWISATISQLMGSGHSSTCHEFSVCMIFPFRTVQNRMSIVSDRATYFASIFSQTWARHPITLVFGLVRPIRALRFTVVLAENTKVLQQTIQNVSINWLTINDESKWLNHMRKYVHFGLGTSKPFSSERMYPWWDHHRA